MTYEAQRAMFEAYRRNKYTATGVVQWMLNDAWPSLIWHLYDYYLRPAGGYFGTKKACEPLHVQYSYDDHSVVVVNDHHRSFPNMRASAKIYDFDMTEKGSFEETLHVQPDSSSAAFTIPGTAGLTPTYFLDLALEDAHGREASSNFYWLSSRREVMAWPLSTWYYTPIAVHADLRSLQHLPPVELEISSAMHEVGDEVSVHATVENTSPHLAFLVHLKLVRDEDGEEILPILWEDNYFSLLPLEERAVAATCLKRDMRGSSPALEADGWNVVPARHPIQGYSRQQGP